ncbi:MAG TPA: TAXI family TRAP transporter solute-binding subunit [Candidatus Acidoferrum sp.]|nr:TAXI family TRAP transporter solute-binding subunit [Candidatus Acidoferrum sp.]
MKNEPTPPPEPTPQEGRKTGLGRLLAPSMDAFGLSRGAVLTTILSISAALALAVFWFFKTAPPKTVILTCGVAGSSFQNYAQGYRTNLASNGVRLVILPSEGSSQNLQRLKDARFQVDVGFVQGGVTNAPGSRPLVSLGSITYEPLFLFYRGAANLSILSELEGKRLAIGPAGSGTRSLALSLLQLNGIEPGGPTQLTDLDALDAVNALLAGKVDAVFLMGDSASPNLIRQLLHTAEIHLFDFAQADAYTRRISYLNKLVLPEGCIDFGKNIPPHDVNLIGPTVELVARPELNAVLSDLLLEAAQEVHGGASVLKRRGEFPAPLEHDFPISADAGRFYKSGKSFLYRSMPFWLASIVRRVLLAFVPAIVVLIPALRVLPSLYRLRMRLRLYRWYRALLALERAASGASAPEKRRQSLARLDHIEKEVNRLKVPASFADQFYGLREHIQFVRGRLAEAADSP